MGNIYLGSNEVDLYSGKTPAKKADQIYTQNEIVYNPQNVPPSGYNSLVLLPFNNNFEDISNYSLDFSGSSASLDTNTKKFGIASLNDDSGYISNDTTNTPLTSIATNNFTLECFVYLTGNTSGKTIIEQSSENSYGNYKLTMDNTNKPKFSYTYLHQEFDTVGTVSIEGSAISLNQWVHLAVVRQSSAGYSASNTRLYIDGSLAGTAGQTVNSEQPIEFLHGEKITVAADSDGSNAFTGFVDHVHLRNFAVYKNGLNFSAPSVASQVFNDVPYTTYPMTPTTTTSAP
jgi:hypothetical protein